MLWPELPTVRAQSGACERYGLKDRPRTGPSLADATASRAAEFAHGDRPPLAREKEWRAVATRYEKAAASFTGVLRLAAALDWLMP